MGVGERQVCCYCEEGTWWHGGLKESSCVSELRYE